jgi:hypothetical protein
MRRVIRHIITLVTFERWSINLERSSTVDSSTQTKTLEELYANDELGTSGQKHEKVDSPEEKASARSISEKSEENCNMWQLITVDDSSRGDSK